MENQKSSADKTISNIKAEDKKAKGIFTIIVIVSVLAGMIIGGALVVLAFMMLEGKINFLEVFSQIQIESSLWFRWVMILSGIVMLSIATGLYRSAKKMWNIKESREENWDKISGRLESSYGTVQIMLVALLTLYGLSAYMLFSTVREHPVSTFVMTALFMSYLFLGLAISKASINLLKEMNPEKRGSIYDLGFVKKWYNSCDEAEKTVIGIASHKAVAATCICCETMIAILAILTMVFEIGMLPIICVGIIFLVQTIVYQYYCKKSDQLLSKHSDCE